LHLSPYLTAPHSFPTRRSSDLSAALNNQQHVCIEVSDTGCGFDLATVPAGHGLDNLVARLDVLYGEAAYLKVLRRDDCCVVQIRSEEHTSELQSRVDLVCRLLL